MMQTAIEAARLAGQTIAEHYPGGRLVTDKGYRDLVTNTDTDSEAIILELVRARFPDHAVVSEEAGGSEISGGYTWLVDPLDGTTNYTHRHPVFSVSIGVLKEGEPILGVIYDPLRDQMFVAEKGAGARLNDNPIHVSRIAGLDKALVGLDWGHTNGVREHILAYLHQIVPRCGTLRVLGSAALAMAYVAAGWLDAYFHLGVKPLDVAAGILIITEAGGRCSTLEGRPYHVNLPGCLVTNNLIHEEMLTAMHGRDVH